MDLFRLTLHELLDLLDRGEVNSEEATRSVLERIEVVEPKVKAYITVCAEEALESARLADRRRKDGEEAPLLGCPISIKDVICTQGIRTTCGSRMLENFIPPYDATVVERLKAAGAVIVGKTNMDEFAMGSSTENSAFYPTANPWDLSRIPGGSSGGSAAAVAADECLASLGSDTGGSIRQPAAHCGIVGLKPTYGRVSRYGLVAFASSLDQIGPMTKDVTDCALLLSVIAGYDPRDSTSAPRPVPDYQKALKVELKGLRIGVPREYFISGIDPEVEKAVKEALALFEQEGAHLVEISLPHSEYAVAAYYIIAPAEASSNLARYDGVKYGFRAQEYRDLLSMYKKTRSEGFGPEVKRRIMLGTYALSAGYYDAFYLKASRVRTLIVEDFQRAFEGCDVIATPVAPTPAFGLGEKLDDPLQMYLSDVFTIATNLAGIPGISIPCGFSREGLPIGLQLMAPHFEEERLLKVAYSFEQLTDYHRARPDL
ncbi:Asp-tRNA(Asn)/Glu-tRNA(Gln) amidotransferase subunit GatA [Thermosulfuriphilus sp.]